jgi:hypothetical protein
MKRSDIKAGMKLYFNNNEVLMNVAKWIGGPLDGMIIVTNASNYATTILSGLLDENLNSLHPDKLNLRLERILSEKDEVLWERPIELTIKQIAEKFGVKPELIRIKE